MKKCTVCELEKPIAEFAQKNNKPTSKCKSCHSAYYKAYYQNNPDKYDALKQRVTANRPRYRGKKYGLTTQEYDALKASNNGLCHICDTRLATKIDHDHATGVVRGHLCNSCNVALGAFGDTIAGVETALLYLKNQ